MTLLSSIRETYGLPRHVPIVVRIAVLMPIPPAVVIGLWLVLPHSAAVVALLVFVAIALVLGGVWRILTSHELDEPPQRRPMPPPSTTPPSMS
jgi:hypothetical protein